MRKSKQNQPTGGEETPGENTPQRALPLCCLGPCTAAVGGKPGAVEAWVEHRAGTVAGAGAGVAVGFGGGHDGPLFGA